MSRKVLPKLGEKVAVSRLESWLRCSQWLQDWPCMLESLWDLSMCLQAQQNSCYRPNRSEVEGQVCALGRMQPPSPQPSSPQGLQESAIAKVWRFLFCLKKSWWKMNCLTCCARGTLPDSYARRGTESRLPQSWGK